MIKFNVPDMTCGHCVSEISKAIAVLQQDAEVTADIANRTVTVKSRLESEQIAAAIKEAGYMATEAKASCCSVSHSCHSS